MIRPSLRAVLVHFNNTSGSGSSSSNNNTWNTDFKGDEKRAAYHAQKMASKVERPALQMRALGEGVPQVWVEHIEISI